MMAGLSDEAILMLTKLDQARMDAEASGTESLGWVDLSGHKKQYRAMLIRFKLMKKDGEIANVYHITPRGQEALMTGFRPTDEPTLEIVKPETRSRMAAGGLAGACTVDDCRTCVYWQAIDILARKVPGVQELVDALKTLDGKR